MPVIKKSLAGPGWAILNILRVMNIVSLLMVIAACWVMLVKTFVVSKFFFFDAVSHLLTSLAALFLIVSEIDLFTSYFERNWPLLSPSSGLVTLGCAMVALGVSTLGNLNKEATSQQSLGTAFWRIVIAGGILVAILGILNIIVSFIFRDKMLEITARQVRTKGADIDKMPPAAATLESVSGSVRRGPPYLYRAGSTAMAERQASVRSNRPAGAALGPKLPYAISRSLDVNHHQPDGFRNTTSSSCYSSSSTSSASQAPQVPGVPPIAPIAPVDATPSVTYSYVPSRTSSVRRPDEAHQPVYWDRV